MQFIFLSFTLTKLLPIFTGQCTIKWPDHCKQKNEIDKLSSNWLVPCQLSYDYYSKHCKTIPHHPPKHLDIDAAILMGQGRGADLEIILSLLGTCFIDPNPTDKRGMSELFFAHIKRNKTHILHHLGSAN